MSGSHRRFIVIPARGLGTPFQADKITQQEMERADFVIDVNARVMEKCRTAANGPIPVRTPTYNRTYKSVHLTGNFDSEPEITTRIKMKPKSKIATMLRKLAPWNF